MANVIGNFKKWVQRFKPYLIGYKDDFFQMYYLLNSPQEMIARFKSMPFVKQDEAGQFFTSQTPFINLTTYYHEFKEKVFVTYSEAEYKANVYFRCLVEKDRPLEYYTLSLRTNHLRNIQSLVNGLSYTDNSWIISKPGAQINLHHFKGTKGHYISMYFTRDWLRQYLTNIQPSLAGELKAFLKSDKDHFVLGHTSGSRMFNAEVILHYFKERSSGEYGDEKTLYRNLQHYLSFFMVKMHEEKLNNRHFEVNNQECFGVLGAKHLLETSLYGKFPGIPFLAMETGLSATKLKECFKFVYGTTLLQYFHSLQMEEAKVQLETSNLPIAAIAKKFHYENPSKFAAAFKKYHVHLPSKFKQSLQQAGAEVQ